MGELIGQKLVQGDRAPEEFRHVVHASGMTSEGFHSLPGFHLFLQRHPDHGVALVAWMNNLLSGSLSLDESIDSLSRLIDDSARKDQKLVPVQM